MLYPILDLVRTCHSNLTAIRHSSLGEAASHELLHCAYSARRFPGRGIIVELVYFLLRVCSQSFSIIVYASRGAEPHTPVTMYTRSQLSAAVVAAQRA